MTIVTVRVDEATKMQAAELAKQFGFDLSSVTRAFSSRLFVKNACHLKLTNQFQTKKQLRQYNIPKMFWMARLKQNFMTMHKAF